MGNESLLPIGGLNGLIKEILDELQPTIK